MNLIEKASKCEDFQMMQFRSLLRFLLSCGYHTRLELLNHKPNLSFILVFTYLQNLRQQIITPIKCLELRDNQQPVETVHGLYM